MKRFSVMGLIVIAAAGCTVGPDYVRPHAPTPAAWQQAPPSVAVLPDAWWRLFGDGDLDRHVEATLAANQDLSGALARYDQSRALLGVARADEFPDITLDPAYTRGRT
ncbi:MAG: RND transporter, partial [Luteibacter sp.]